MEKLNAAIEALYEQEELPADPLAFVAVRPRAAPVQRRGLSQACLPRASEHTHARQHLCRKRLLRRPRVAGGSLAVSFAAQDVITGMQPGAAKVAPTPVGRKPKLATKLSGGA
jgi:hypothetical protein